MNSMRLRALWAPMLCALVSCGGGGGSGAGDQQSDPSPVTVHFANPETVQVFLGQTYVNPVLDSERLGYAGHESSDKSVARVWDNGVVTLVAAGQATITARRSYSDRNSYVLDVREPAVVSAWVGPNDALVEEDASLVGTSLEGAGTFVDTWLTLTRSVDYSLSRGGAEVSHLMTVERLGPWPRTNFTLTSFKGRLWLLGGDYGGNFSSEIWSSADGLIWRRESAAAPFGPRVFHQVIEYQNQLWLVGGITQLVDGEQADVWRSSDGVNWEEVTDSAPFAPRHSHQLQVFNDRLWLFGGRGSRDNFRDVWSSADGMGWRREVEAAAYPAGGQNQIAQFRQKLWLTSSNSRNVIWSSTDGVNWLRDEVELPALSGLHQFQVVGDTLWLFDCYGSSGAVIKKSSDGLQWQSMLGQARIPQSTCKIAWHQDRFWLLGRAANENSDSDPYWSEDGVNWMTRSRAQVYGLRDVDVLSKDGKLWVMEGSSGINYGPRIWSSVNGIYWRSQQQETTPRWLSWDKDNARWLQLGNQFWFVPGDQNSVVTSSADGVEWTVGQSVPFPTRSGQQVVAFNDQIFVIGGHDGASRNDIWTYDPAGSWTHATLAAAFSPRRGHQVVKFNSRLWLIGGYEYRDGAYFHTNDIWSSTDGVNWVRELEHAPFAARSDHRLAEFDGRLWLVGGVDASSPLKDVWSSADGVHWIRHGTAPFAARSKFGFIAHKGRLLVIGGEVTGYKGAHDVWSTQDGETWRQAVWEEFLLP